MGLKELKEELVDGIISNPVAYECAFVLLILICKRDFAYYMHIELLRPK